MATKRDITDIIAGDDYGVDRIIHNVPAGETVVKAWLTIKERVTDDDADALVQLEITDTGTVDGLITDTGTDQLTERTAALTFELSADETLQLVPRTPYPYDIQVLLSNGKVATSDIGNIITKQGVTQVTS